MTNSLSPFRQAEPIWVQFNTDSGQVDSGWLRATRFGTEFSAKGKAKLRIAGWTSVRAWVNGKFVFYGPARCGLAHFRWEEIDISHHLVAGANELVVELVSYGIPTFSHLEQDPFLQAEVESDGKIVAFTGLQGSFKAQTVPERRRKVQRYSYMRGFSEAYNIQAQTGAPPLDLSIVGAQGGGLIPRRTPAPSYTKFVPEGRVLEGDFTGGPIPKTLHKDRTIENIGKDVTSWPTEDFEVFPSKDWQALAFRKAQVIEATNTFSVTEGKYFDLEFGFDITALVGATIQCIEAGTLYLAVDEIRDEGKLNPLRNSCMSVLQIDMEPGKIDFLAAEPMTFKYLRVVGRRGSFEVFNIHALEIAHPQPKNWKPSSTDPDLQLVERAAMATLRPNSFDFFSDCPGRERGGYECDSFFTSRAAHLMFGNTLVEEAFIENFAVAPKFDGIPEGMLPMCYPSDALGGTYIPQWPLWLIVQMADALKRGINREVIQLIRPKIEGLLGWFEPFLNRIGLLESLDGWNFIEWSGANDLIAGIHFPTNMLYAAALDASQELYGHSFLAECKIPKDRSKLMRKKIHEMAYDGQFYHDHALASQGSWQVQPKCSEVCQSFAFFFGLASPTSQAQLWQLLVNRQEIGKHLIAPNTFIGDVLRLDLLTRHGEFDAAEKEIRGLFLPMAEKTGTLWEMQTDWASCCHGFASYLSVLIKRISERT